MITANEARQTSDAKKSVTFINKAEKAIQAAMNKGEYYAIIENTELKSIPESAIKQLKELGYTIREYETSYYTDKISNVEISWRHIK